MDKKNTKIIFMIGVMITFIFPSFTTMTIGYTNGTKIIKLNESTNENYFKLGFDIYDLPEFVAKERFPDLYYQKVDFDTKKKEEYSDNIYKLTSNEIIAEVPIHSLNDPVNSQWPMLGHDVRHTGNSPYNTIDTWDEKWRFNTLGWADSSPAIASDGTIYIGSWNFYAVNPNGTLEWSYDTLRDTVGGTIESICPAIDENGVVYVGTCGGDSDYLYSFYPNGTVKWKYPASAVYTSPVIVNNQAIIFADSDNWNIKALNPNGTQKWSFHTNMVIYSSPAIGQAGTIYCGSHDGNVYALYPENGTLKWSYNTGNWVHGSPTIADDGTVYIGSDNGYLYAFYPNNGTVKWAINIGEIYGSLALDEDGIIYTGVWENTFYAINPNGSIKWSFNTGAHVWGSSPALSDDGTLYFGTCNLDWTGGIEIIALYTDGTVKWRKSLDTVFSSPAISADGTVYIGSNDDHLYAFGIGPLEVNANGPYFGLINQHVQFKGKVTGGYSPHSYYWDFGDGETSEAQNPSHTYSQAGNYSVILTVTDNTSNTSTDTTWAWIQATNTPPNQPTINGKTKGIPGTSYEYTFKTTDPDESIIWYFVDWGDNTNTGWIGPYDSGTEITEAHTWSDKGTYSIRCKAKDPYNAESEWGTLQVTMPRNKTATNSLLLRFLEQFRLFNKMLHF